MPDGVLIEVIDDGSADMPVVRSELLATDGHGLYLVQQLAAQWGYLRDPAGTTVWFHLVADGEPEAWTVPSLPHSGTRRHIRAPLYLCRASRAAAW